MCLEQGIASEKLDEDASDAPYVAREAPAKVEDNLGSAVVTRGYNGRVVLVVEGCRAKVDEPDFRIQKYPSELGRPGRCGRRRGDIAVVCKGLILVMDE